MSILDYLIPIIANLFPLSSSNFYYKIDCKMNHRQMVGKNIELARTVRGWSQAQLAEEMGVEQTYVSKVEKGKVNVSIDTLERFAAALRKPLAFFFQEIDVSEVQAKKASGKR